MGVGMIKILDTSGATIHLRPEAIMGISIPSALSSGPDTCQIMLGGNVFLTVSRSAAELVLKELEKV